jgi:hypothetical protein
MAVEVCERYTLAEAPRQFLKDETPAEEFVTTLLDKKLHADAVKFVAYALPKKGAVRWACSCAHIVKADGAGLDAAEKWLEDPSDENRRAAMDVAKAEGFKTPGACAALAAFLSEGSLTPPNLQAVAPAEHLTAEVVTGAVILAAVSKEPEKAPEKYRQFVSLGLDLVNAASSAST